MIVLAEGDLLTGERWILRVGGTVTDFNTSLETIYPGGHRDRGGIAGPALYPGQLVNVYTGGTGRGLRRVVVRADPRVTELRLHIAGIEALDLKPVATLVQPALSFFVTLLPAAACLVSVTPVVADRNQVGTVDLTAHEIGWRRFLARQPPKK